MKKEERERERERDKFIIFIQMEGPGQQGISSPFNMDTEIEVVEQTLSTDTDEQIPETTSHARAPLKSSTAVNAQAVILALQQEKSISSRGRRMIPAIFGFPQPYNDYESTCTCCETLKHYAGVAAETVLFTTSFIITLQVVLLVVSVSVGLVTIRERKGLMRVMLALLLSSEVVVTIAGTIYAILRKRNMKDNKNRELKFQVTATGNSGRTIRVDKHVSVTLASERASNWQ